MVDEPRRSRRRAYVSLQALQERARAAAPADEHDALWGEEGVDDDDDESFNEDVISDIGEDIVDSDFDDPEEDDNDENIITGAHGTTKPSATSTAEAAVRAEERRVARRERASKYVDPASKKNVATDRGGTSQSNQTGKGDQDEILRSEPKLGFGTLTAEKRTSLRKSTKAASARAAEERARRRVDEEERRRQKALRDAEKKPVRPLTQAERLEEAKVTEELNRKSLNELLRMEEEKKSIVVVKKRETGPVISTRSRDGKTTVSLSEGVDVSEALFPQMSQNPPQ